MQSSTRQTKVVALLAGGVLMSSALSFTSAPAHAISSEKAYKYGAVGLGALGAYYLYKGKTLKGALAVGAGYYAYKKGADENDDYSNDNRYGNRNYGYNRNGSAYPNARSARNGNGNYNNGNYNGGSSDRYPD